MGLQYGRVKGRFLGSIIDGIDADDIPDIVSMSGYVVISPKVEELRVTDVADPYTLLPQPFRIDLAGDGSIKNNGSKLIAVIATDSPNIGVSGWNYRAEFYLRDPQGAPVNKASFEFKVPTGAEVDLTVVAPVASSAGTIITRGASAYEIARENGFQGTVTQWLESLKGTGGTGSGTAGESAYQIAKRLGYTGTETEWIASLRGAPGTSVTGATGKSAYQLAQDGGYTGTLTQWLASLKGAQGSPGASAYQVAVANGFTGSETDWLASLRGADGASSTAPVGGTIQGYTMQPDPDYPNSILVRKAI
jgi:hypothetical protein